MSHSFQSIESKQEKRRTDRTHEGDDLSEVACDLQVTLLVLITVWYDDLRACLCCVSALDIVPTTPSKKTPTELGDEISAEEARAAKDGRDVPCYRTAPSRTLRDDRRPTGEREHIMQSPLVQGKSK